MVVLHWIEVFVYCHMAALRLTDACVKSAVAAIRALKVHDRLVPQSLKIECQRIG